MVSLFAAPGQRTPWLTVLAGMALGAGLAVGAPAESMTARRPARVLLLDIARADTRVIAVGEHGVIIESDDMGRTWTQVRVPADTMLTCVSFSDSHHGWAGGQEGVILETQDAGTTWTRPTTPATVDDSILDMLALADGHVFAVGAYGLFLASADNGATWTRRPALDEDLHINRITIGTSGTLYLAAEAGTLATSHDGGTTWTRLETPYDGSFFGFYELSSGRLFAHGLRGHAFFSDDSGETWTQATVAHNGLLATEVELPGNAVALAGAGGHLFVSRDGGVTFPQDVATGLSAVAEILNVGNSVLCVGDSGVFAVQLPKP